MALASRPSGIVAVENTKMQLPITALAISTPVEP